MALARLALKNMQQRLGSASSAPSLCRASQIRQGWNSSDEAMVMNRRFLSTATEKASDDKEVAVSEKGDGRKSRLFPRRNRRRSLWRRNDDADFVPALYGNMFMSIIDYWFPVLFRRTGLMWRDVSERNNFSFGSSIWVRIGPRLVGYFMIGKVSLPWSEQRPTRTNQDQTC